MDQSLKIAVVGVGRIGVHHARHVQELSAAGRGCHLAAVVDSHEDLAAQVADRLQPGQQDPLLAYRSVAELLEAGCADAAVIASRTEDHYPHAKALIEAGMRVLLEKPLTHSVESAHAFSEWLEAEPGQSTSLMQAFMRRYDGPLLHAKQQLDARVLGRVFKIVSILEDPGPPPDGYNSPGLLMDMAVHNIDEILWLSGAKPVRVTGTGSVLYNQTVTSVREDFDDAFLHMWCEDDLVGQVIVSRNHVAGYRNETTIYGDRGFLRIGAFQDDVTKVFCEGYSRVEQIETRTFRLPVYREPVPVFMERFGPAYKAELEDFVTCCLSKSPFQVTHLDGLRALIVAEAGSKALLSDGDGAIVPPLPA